MNPTSRAGRISRRWKPALGELAIVSIGVLLALWADQAMQARREAAITKEIEAHRR